MIASLITPVESSALNTRDLTRRDSGGSFVDALDDIGETPKPLRRAWSADARAEDKAQSSLDDEAVVVAHSETGSDSTYAVAQDNEPGVQADGSAVEAGETIDDDEVVPTFGIADALAQMSQLPQVTGQASSRGTSDQPDVALEVLSGSASTNDGDSPSSPILGESTPEMNLAQSVDVDPIVSSSHDAAAQIEVGAEVSTKVQELSSATAAVADGLEADLAASHGNAKVTVDGVDQSLTMTTSESSSAVTVQQDVARDVFPMLADDAAQATADGGSAPDVASALSPDGPSSGAAAFSSSADGSSGQGSSADSESADASISAEPSVPAVNVNSVEGVTGPASAAPAAASGNAVDAAPDTVVVNRILDTIEVMSRQPPPRTLTLDLTDMHGVRVTLSITSSGVSLVVADTGAGDANTQQWEQQLDQLLSNRGFGSNDRSGNRSDSDTRSEPDSIRPRRPVLRAPVSNSTELRL